MTTDGPASQGPEPDARASGSGTGEQTPEAIEPARGPTEGARPADTREAQAPAAVAPEASEPPLATPDLAEPGGPGPAEPGGPRPAEPGSAVPETALGGNRLGGYIAATLGLLIVLAAVALAATGGGGSTASSPGPAADLAARTLGNADAPVTIEVWADYQCPGCRALTTAIEPSLEREYVHSGEARIVFQDFAFLGPESVDAAISARCAGRQGAYWRYHDLLYALQQGENQGRFGGQNLAFIASLAGLDIPAYTACIADPAIRSAVMASTSAGNALEIAATPTLRFIGPAGTISMSGVPGWPKVKLTMDQVTGRAPMPSPAPAASPSATAPAASGAPAPTSAPGASAAPPPPSHGTPTPSGSSNP